MNDVPVNILKTVIAHASHQKPRANVWVLFYSQRILSLSSSIYVKCCKVAGELASVFCDQAPLGELLMLRTFDKESANFVASEFKPEHIVCQVEH